MSSLSPGHKAPACRQLVGPGESFQLLACSQGSPTYILPPPHPFSPNLPPGCWRQDVTQATPDIQLCAFPSVGIYTTAVSLALKLF